MLKSLKSKLLHIDSIRFKVSCNIRLPRISIIRYSNPNVLTKVVELTADSIYKRVIKMITKEEFQEMWGKRYGDVKKVRFGTRSIISTSEYYIIGSRLYLIINHELIGSFGLENVSGIIGD